KLIAGGQSLLPMMKLRLAAPQVLIDIGGLKELRTGGFTARPGGSFNFLIGALTTYRQLDRNFFSADLPPPHPPPPLPPPPPPRPSTACRPATAPRRPASASSRR